MRREVKLAVSYDGAKSHELSLKTNRFTVGRSIDDDLCIDDPSMSRHHALIEMVDGAILVSDCGSRNGTFVNDSKIEAPTVLRDGDVISVGSIATITVMVPDSSRLRSRASPVAAGKRQADNLGPPLRQSHQTGKERQTSTRRFVEASPRTVSGIAGASILLIVLLLAFLKGGGHSSNSSGSSPSVSGQTGDTSRSQSLDAGAGTGAEEKGATAEISRELVERAALQVVKQISNDDQQYSFPPEAIDQLKDKIREYAVSSQFAASLRSIAPQTRDIAREARPMIEPGLVIYTALAETASGTGGRNSVQAARASLPVLSDIWKLLGNRTADDSLILIAAYKIGPVTALDRTGRRSHPLLATMRRVSQGSDAKRTVWYLYKQNGIDRETYGFVLGFLAAGILAQHPREFGISAEPLAF